MRIEHFLYVRCTAKARLRRLVFADIGLRALLDLRSKSSMTCRDMNACYEFAHMLSFNLRKVGLLLCLQSARKLLLVMKIQCASCASIVPMLSFPFVDSAGRGGLLRTLPETNPRPMQERVGNSTR